MQRETPPRPTWQVWTRRQAADILQVHVSQVDAAIKRGDLECTRIGRNVRIADAALQRYAGQAVT